MSFIKILGAFSFLEISVNILLLREVEQYYHIISMILVKDDIVPCQPILIQAVL